MIELGATLTLDVGPVAHGGCCVARHGDLVVFVRHALPGERVTARLTEVRSRYARAEVVEVVEPSAHRVQPRCPYAVPGGCGGCDWQHAEADYQRELKTAVIREQMRRLAGVDAAASVEGTGLDWAWRTRVRFSTDPGGRAGFHRFRSSEVVAVDRCPIAHPVVEAAGVEGRRRPEDEAIEVAASSSSGEFAVTEFRRGGGSRRTGARRLTHTVRGRTFRVSPRTFWQVHPSAAELLVDAVLAGLRPQHGDRAVDLYCGAGLFAAFLAQAVGPSGRVLAVEGDPAAVRDAAHNLRDLGVVDVRHADVGAALRRGAIESIDLAVVDPPRSGLTPVNVSALAALRPRAVAYVACDPAALARDLAAFADAGYRLGSLRAFDIFPQTHHVECVAILTREGRRDARHAAVV